MTRTRDRKTIQIPVTSTHRVEIERFSRVAMVARARWQQRDISSRRPARRRPVSRGKTISGRCLTRREKYPLTRKPLSFD